MKKQLLSKKEIEVKDLENSQLALIAKNEKACLEENTKGMVIHHLVRRLMCVYTTDLISHLNRSQE